MTTQEKVAHLNKLTMSALTSEAAYLNQEDNDVRDYIRQLRSEGHNIQMANDSHQYSESDLHVVDRLVAWITQIIYVEKIIKYEEHEIGALAQAKPALVEKIVDNATQDVLRCFEIESGSPLTQEEINATRPSEINTSCPDIANPNYRP